MTDVAGRLAGVTVLVLTSRFLSGYVCAVLRDAQAVAVAPAVAECNAAFLSGALAPHVACVEMNLEGIDAIAPMLEARGIPCLVLSRTGRSEVPGRQLSGPVLRQPFAGFQIVDAVQDLLKAIS